MATQNDTSNDVINQLAELNRVYAELIGFIQIHETASMAVSRLLGELSGYQLREQFAAKDPVPEKSPADNWPLPVKWPEPPPTPTYTLSTACPVCGIGANGAMGYVCTRVDCPSGFAVSSSEVKYDPSVPMTFTLDDSPLVQTKPYGDQQLTNTTPWTEWK